MQGLATGAGAAVQEQDRQTIGSAALLDVQRMQRVHGQMLGRVGPDIGKESAH